MSTINIEKTWIVKSTDNLASFKQIDVTGFRTGIVVEVVDMTPKGGQFIWDENSSKTADDKNTILPDGHTGNGRWLRQSFNGMELTDGGKISKAQIEEENIDVTQKIISYPVADITALKAFNVSVIDNGCMVLVRASTNGGVFYWNSTSSATSDDINIITPNGHVGNGRWLRQSFPLKLTAGLKISKDQLEEENIDVQEKIIAYPVADLAALKAKSTTALSNGVLVKVLSMTPIGGTFRLDINSGATPDDNNVVLPTGETGNKRWIRETRNSMPLTSLGLISKDIIEAGSGEVTTKIHSAGENTNYVEITALTGTIPANGYVFLRITESGVYTLALPVEGSVLEIKIDTLNAGATVQITNTSPAKFLLIGSDTTYNKVTMTRDGNFGNIKLMRRQNNYWQVLSCTNNLFWSN